MLTDDSIPLRLKMAAYHHVLRLADRADPAQQQRQQERSHGFFSWSW